jgi:hypothetical protein
MATHYGDMYRQACIGINLYRSKKEREAGRHIHHLAMGAEWLADETPQGFAEDSWLWDDYRNALRENGGSVRRGNAGGGFTESYLDGDMIRTRQVQ